jgi:hexosaminidase
MWGEDVDSQTLDPQVWPRAAAIAERLWSPQDVTDVKDATVRMVALSCVLKQRGINSVPLAPGFCPLPSDFAN